MKFVAASLFVVLLVGSSFGSPSPKHRGLDLNLGGLLGGVVDTADHLLGGLLETVDNTVANLSVVLRNVLRELPHVTAEVVRIVDQLLRETGEALVCTVKEVVDGVLHFTAEVTDGIIDVSINLDTLEVSINGKKCGTVSDDGSICDSEGNVIGLLDTVKGVLVFVGKTAHELLEGVDNVVGDVDHLLGGVLDALGNAVENLSVEIRHILEQLPPLTADVVNAVDQLLHDTGKVLVCTVENLVGNILTFIGKEESGEDVIVELDTVTREITIDGVLIGTLSDDGSIISPEGDLIGMLDPDTGCIVFVDDVPTSQS